MKQLKEYYRYFYQDRVPVMKPGLKRYHQNVPAPNRAQLERYLNDVNPGGGCGYYQQQASFNPLEHLQQQVNHTVPQNVGYQPVPTVNGHWLNGNRAQVVTSGAVSFVNRTQGDHIGGTPYTRREEYAHVPEGMVPRPEEVVHRPGAGVPRPGVEVPRSGMVVPRGELTQPEMHLVAYPRKDIIPYDDDDDIHVPVKHTHSDVIEINSDCETEPVGEKPMDLSVETMYGNTEQEQIFEGLSRDSRVEPESEDSGEEALDLSTKPQNIAHIAARADFLSPQRSEFSSLLSQNDSNRSVEERRILYGNPTRIAPVEHADSPRDWSSGTPSSRAPPAAAASTPHTSREAVSEAKKNSILFKILNEKAVIGLINGGGEKPPQMALQSPPEGGMNTVPPPRNPSFQCAQLLRTKYQMNPCYGQQKPPSPDDMYRKLPLSPASSAGSGSATPPRPRSPVEGPPPVRRGYAPCAPPLPLPLPPQPQPVRYRCPQRGIRYRKPVTNNTNRPSLQKSILSEMGIAPRPTVQTSPTSGAGAVNIPAGPGTSSAPAAPGSGSSSQAEGLIDVMTVQNVYVNYLRRILKNADDESVVKTDTNATRVTDPNLGDEHNGRQALPQNTLPTFIGQITVKSECKDELEDKPLPSDMMAILQAQVLKKSLHIHDIKTEDSTSDLGAGRKSTMDTIHSLIDEEFYEFKY